MILWFRASCGRHLLCIGMWCTFVLRAMEELDAIRGHFRGLCLSLCSHRVLKSLRLIWLFLVLSLDHPSIQGRAPSSRLVMILPNYSEKKHFIPVLQGRIKEWFALNVSEYLPLGIVDSRQFCLGGMQLSRSKQAVDIVHVGISPLKFRHDMCTRCIDRSHLVEDMDTMMNRLNGIDHPSGSLEVLSLEFPHHLKL